MDDASEAAASAPPPFTLSRHARYFCVNSRCEADFQNRKSSHPTNMTKIPLWHRGFDLNNIERSSPALLMEKHLLRPTDQDFPEEFYSELWQLGAPDEFFPQITKIFNPSLCRASSYHVLISHKTFEIKPPR